jgi:hypothetical protein
VKRESGFDARDLAYCHHDLLALELVAPCAPSSHVLLRWAAHSAWLPSRGYESGNKSVRGWRPQATTPTTMTQGRSPLRCGRSARSVPLTSDDGGHGHSVRARRQPYAAWRSRSASAAKPWPRGRAPAGSLRRAGGARRRATPSCTPGCSITMSERLRPYSVLLAYLGCQESRRRLALRLRAVDAVDGTSLTTKKRRAGSPTGPTRVWTRSMMVTATVARGW